MNKETILEMVRSEIKRQANTDVFEALSHEAFDDSGYDEFAIEGESLTSSIRQGLEENSNNCA